MSSNISGYRYWWQGVSGKGGDDDGGSDDDDGDGDGDSDDGVEEREVAAS